MQLIESLWTPDAIPKIRSDLTHPGDVWILSYYLDLRFFHMLFLIDNRDRTVHLLADRTQRDNLRDLKLTNPTIQARIWSKTWVMHCKAILLPGPGIAYVGSPNLSWYSYQRALNITLRIDSRAFADELLGQIQKRWNLANPIE